MKRGKRRGPLFTGSWITLHNERRKRRLRLWNLEIERVKGELKGWNVFFGGWGVGGGRTKIICFWNAGKHEGRERSYRAIGQTWMRKWYAYWGSYLLVTVTELGNLGALAYKIIKCGRETIWMKQLRLEVEPELVCVQDRSIYVYREL